jgi:hypothetical protein
LIGSPSGPPGLVAAQQPTWPGVNRESKFVLIGEV